MRGEHAFIRSFCLDLVVMQLSVSLNTTAFFEQGMQAYDELHNHKALDEVGEGQLYVSH